MNRSYYSEAGTKSSLYLWNHYIIDDEIIYLPDSRRDEGYKEIVHDVLFSYKSDIIPTRNSTVTVDYEMENSRQSYPIAARGTY